MRCRSPPLLARKGHSTPLGEETIGPSLYIIRRNFGDIVAKFQLFRLEMLPNARGSCYARASGLRLAREPERNQPFSIHGGQNAWQRSAARRCLYLTPACRDPF